MRLRGRGTSSEHSHARNERGSSRGAWYEDPFGVGDERWWDGTRWTREVRNSASADGVSRPPDRASEGVSRPPTEGIPHPPDRASEDGQLDVSSVSPQPPQRSPSGRRDHQFPVDIEALVEEQLSVVPSPRKPGTHCQILASRGRAGSISMFGGQMARLACARGAWVLKKSPKDARALTIESADRQRAGSYRRRQWLPGGNIRLLDGTEVELRRSRPGRWKVKAADGGQCLAEVRRSRHRSVQELKLTVHSLPGDATNASMIILAACALLMLPARFD